MLHCIYLNVLSKKNNQHFKMKNSEIEKQHTEYQERFNKERLVYGVPEEHFKMVAIGYLDVTEPFEKGVVSTNFIMKLYALWNEGLTLNSLGSHICEFCGEATSNSEKELVDTENKIKYFLPKMIFHYIEVHKFKPSDEFISFVVTK